jgi:hypothetical protein
MAVETKEVIQLKTRIQFAPFRNLRRGSLLTAGCLICTILPAAFQVSAAILWSDSVFDTDSDLSVGYYADVESVTIGSDSELADELIALIEPYNAVSTSFFVTGSGALSFDTNLDGVADYVAYAPTGRLLSPSTTLSREVVTGSLQLTGCYSKWSVTSTYDYYAVYVPWRCLGAASQFRIEAWLSNSVGYDFLTFGRTLYPVLPPATTTTAPPTTAPPTTAPPTTAPPTTAPAVVVSVPAALVVPASQPLAATQNTSVPGFIDNWITYLVVGKSVSVSAVINSSNCCTGSPARAATITAMGTSKGSCVVRSRRLYALKVGRCYVRLSVTSPKRKTETLKFAVKTK